MLNCFLQKHPDEVFMRVQSLIYENFQHHLVEVEVGLHPGLPGIQILGLPDAVVRDCVWRIKSAFLQSGFMWPTTSQVIVNLKPSNLKKKGAGLDLAIATALIWETGQSEILNHGSEAPLLYGELDLQGEVHTPVDFLHYLPKKDQAILTGRLGHGLGAVLPFDCLSISSLKDLANPRVVQASDCIAQCVRPTLPNIRVSHEMAEIISVISVGEHSTLFAGRAGTGKTTAAHLIHAFIDEPNRQGIQEYSRYHSHNPISWRPFRSPHHTTSALAMIGGGGNVQPGELTRAHGGILLMDEFLEFESSVQEALREPMERGVIELIRCTKAKTLPAEFLLLATANLCKCGEYEPGHPQKCLCGHVRRNRYLERMSGPVLDRFGVIVFSHAWEGNKTVKVAKILKQVEDGIGFRKTARGQKVPNAKLSAAELKLQLSPTANAYFNKEVWTSERRSLHLLRVARSFADLAQSPSIQLGHLEQARVLSVTNVGRLKNVTAERFLPVS